MRFICYGHEEISGTHSTTLEFTKDSRLTKNGDCIIGVNCDFENERIIDLVKEYDEIEVTLLVEKKKFSFTSKTNKKFNDNNELVFRKSEFDSIRTLGIQSTKTANDIPRTLIQKMKNPKQKIEVTIHGKKTGK